MITILCLGADAALTLTHKLNVVKLEYCTSLPPESLTDTEMIVTSAIPEELEVEPDLKLEDMALDNSHVIGESNITTSDKKESNDVVITLVHGDVLVLAATDFEVYLQLSSTIHVYAACTLSLLSFSATLNGRALPFVRYIYSVAIGRAESFI